MVSKRLIQIICLLSILHSLSISAAALEIVSPNEGQKVEIGSTVRVVVRPQAGETFIRVSVGANDELTYNSTDGTYVRDFSIPKDVNPHEMQITIFGLTADNQVVKLQPRKIKLVLPSSIVLQNIIMRDDQKIMFFYNLGRVKHLDVDGQYSDGVTRPIDNMDSGTVFEISDPTVATVTPNGDVQGIKNGKAIITIRNGKLIEKISVTVKAATSN